MAPSVFTITRVIVLLSVLDVCLVSAVYIEDCMGNRNSDNLLHVSQALTEPAHIVAPGSWRVNINFEILHNITRELELSVIVKKKIWVIWITVHQSTHSLCDVLNNEFLDVDGTTVCPSQLANAGIPCRCPFTRGRYSLPWTSFDVIKPSGVPYVGLNEATKCCLLHLPMKLTRLTLDGRYWTKARLRDPDTRELKACHSVEFDLSRY